GELASALSLSELGVSRVVRDLVDLGVAEVVPPTSLDRGDDGRRLDDGRERDDDPRRDGEARRDAARRGQARRDGGRREDGSRSPLRRSEGVGLLGRRSGRNRSDDAPPPPPQPEPAPAPAGEERRAGWLRADTGAQAAVPAEPLPKRQPGNGRSPL